MTPTILDFSRLPPQGHYGPGHQANLASIVHLAQQDIASPGGKLYEESVGFVMAKPTLSPNNNAWNDPYKPVWFCAGWGQEWKLHVFNALRMLPPVARTGKSTLELCSTDSAAFQSVVEPREPNGDHHWGEIMLGGGVLIEMDDKRLISGVSIAGEDGQRNHDTALMLLTRIGAEMRRLDTPA